MRPRFHGSIVALAGARVGDRGLEWGIGRAAHALPDEIEDDRE
jgi:hypothetical protein